MRFLIALLGLVMISTAQAVSFKINSYYYHDTYQNYDGRNDLIIYQTDTLLQCAGGSSDKIYIDRFNESGNKSPNNYMLIKFWPSYFLRSAAQLGLQVEAQIGVYNGALQACEVSFNPYQPEPYRDDWPLLPASNLSFELPHQITDHPIRKVHYKLFKEPSTPTWEAYIFAELDSPIECLGNSTNNILVSSVKDLGNWGSFGSTANAYNGAAEYKTRYFFDLVTSRMTDYTVQEYRSAIDVCITSGAIFEPLPLGEDPTIVLEEGRQQCINDPASCNLFSQEELDNAIDIAFEDGINFCQTNPEACGLFNQVNLDESFQSGQQACIDNPNSCGLFSNNDITNATSAGMQACKDNPSSCGLFSQMDIDSSELKGRQNCINNPSSCGLFNEEAVAKAYQSGISSCIADPTSCGLFSQLDLNASFQEGKNQCINDPQSCGLLTQNDLNQSVEDYKNQLRNELKAIPGAYRSICRKQPSFSLCEEQSHKPDWRSKFKRIIKHFKQWWH